ncbi:hypothetical protein ABZ705_20285 [Streptomyces sp. NPDC006984]|uniref:hypothetical protein n=1 Tax=Streptomyces sp. NPDC006984 TaxID=3155463 RepID=UPI00340F49F8
MIKAKRTLTLAVTAAAAAFAAVTPASADALDGVFSNTVVQHAPQVLNRPHFDQHTDSDASAGNTSGSTDEPGIL